MSVEIIKYAYDDTGQSITNLTSGEEHKVHPSTLFVLPRGGCYYRDSLTITDIETGLPLKEGEGMDYIFGNFYQEATLEVGQSIYGTIFFEKELDTTISIEAQYVGGKYSIDTVGIGDLLNQINAQGSKILWDDVIKPEDGVKSSLHYHSTDTDLMGTQEVVAAILQLADNVLELKQVNSDGVSADWVETRLNNVVKHIPDANTVLTPEDFDGRTFLFIGHSSPVELAIEPSLTVTQSVYVYAVESGSTIHFTDPAATAVHGQPVVSGSVTLNKGSVYKIDPLPINEYLVTEHA